MGKTSYYLLNMIKYWKKLITMLRNSSEWHLSEITADELNERLSSNQPPIIFDVRSVKEFNDSDGHIPNAMSIPIRKLSSELKDPQSYIFNYKEKEIVTLCPGGGLSLVAVDIMEEAGFENVKSLHDGFDLWRKKGYPTTTTKEMKISKRKMFFKLLRLWLWTIRKRKFYLPEVSEITVEELFKRLNSNQDPPPLLIDLRDRVEFAGTGEYKYEKFGHIQNSKWIPLMELSSSLEELPKDQEIVTICQGGGMSLVAVEIMVGFEDVKSLKDGIKKWHKKGYPLIIEAPLEDDTPSKSEGISQIIKGKRTPNEKFRGEIHHTVDARGFTCPRPILMSKKALITLKAGQVLEILTTDPGSIRDIPSWAHVTGQDLLTAEERGPKDFRFLVQKMK
ncbi:MAG: rhodanese-like domain-containing protein [Candidatus Hodarchaeales archaeon]